MTSHSESTLRRIAAGFAIALCAALYLADLTGMGMVSVDEPRYAAIGRAMAASGDWVTPRLWGSAWFEKPALLYWMVGAGFRAGLGPDLAPRLPVALLSLGFLTFFWFRLRELWDSGVATWSTAILATSTGWLAYSHVAITDLPLAATFGAAVLLCLGEKLTARQALLVAAALGLAVLAKSLVGLVLFAPVLVLEGRWRQLLRPGPVAVFVAVALPWHLLCYWQNGFEFVKVLFLEHQFGRFSSTALQHSRKFWYYVPVLLMLLFPWFPLLAVAPRTWGDRRVRTLWITAGFGFAFLSSSVNKLPHYVLPMVPLLAILMGLGLARSARPGRVLLVPVTLLGLLPLAARVAPAALANGLRSVPIPWGAGVWLLGALAVGLALAIRFAGVARAAAMGLAAVAFLWFQFAVFPAIDAMASMRPLWVREHPPCSPGTERLAIYGLSYYADKAMEPCEFLDPQRDSAVR